MSFQWGLFLVAFLQGCGASTGQIEETDDVAPAADARAESARAALVEGDLDRARRLGSQAHTLDPEHPVALEVLARVMLAGGEMEDVVSLLEDARRPRLVRLRARARARLGDYAGVASDLESVAERDPPDGWAEAMLPVARAARATQAFAISGPERATLAMSPEAPVPVVEISVDGAPTNALVATAADLTVLDDQVRATPGVAREIGLGAITVANVPVLSRDLESIGAALGIPIGAVIGLDLMSRLTVTIDGRARSVVLHRVPPAPSERASRVPFVTFEGSFLAVNATIDGRVSGWLTIDTSGGFPIALAPSAVEALGLDPERLEPVPNAPSPEVRMTTLSTLRFGQVEIEGVPGVTGLVPPDLSELAGAPISGMMGAAMIQQLSLTLDPRERALFLE